MCNGGESASWPNLGENIHIDLCLITPRDNNLGTYKLVVVKIPTEAGPLRSNDVMYNKSIWFIIINIGYNLAGA